MTTYKVTREGQSSSEDRYCTPWIEAAKICLQMAREQAVAEGIDPDGVELYENNGQRGACPDGDDGGFWPVIVESSSPRKVEAQ